MLKVFISTDILEDIIFEGEVDAQSSYDSIYKILKCHDTDIYVSEKIPDEMSDALAMFCQSYENIPKDNRCSYISNIQKNPSTVLKEPTSVFLLDIPKEDAERIQQSYGVICLSREDAYKAGEMLMDDNKEYSPDEKEDFEEGWKTILNDVSKLPSNALIINDRYLFSQKRDEYGNGFKNLKWILDMLLPKKFGGTEQTTSYNVLIIYDPIQVYDENMTFPILARKLCKDVSELRKNYCIKVEVLGINKVRMKNSLHNKFHNRRIVSNYYIVKAEQQLAAFNGKIATCSQTITPQRLFTEDSLVRNTNSSSPQRSMRQIIEALESFDPNVVIGEDGYLAYQYIMYNGYQVSEQCSSIANRLVRKKIINNKKI